VKPIFNQKWAAEDMEWGGGVQPQPPAIPTLLSPENYDANIV